MVAVWCSGNVLVLITCFTTQHQTCKTKTKTDFLVSVRSCPKTDGLRPHHSLVTAPTEMRSEKKEETSPLKMELQLCHVRRFSGNLIGIVVIKEEDGMGR